MFNYFHVFILIMSLTLIKTLFLTNKNIRQILSKSIIILTFSLVVLVVGLNILQPISKLIDLSSEKDEVRLYLSSFDYGDYNELIIDERNRDLLKSILDNYEVSYTLKPPKSFLSTSEDIISVYIGYESGNRYFTILSNNILHYNNKFYKVKKKDLYSYLLDVIKDGKSKD